jgi:holo-[acyl-carrier protein] synthase
MGTESVGIDLVEVGRVARMAEEWGDRFLARVYTPAEIAYCRGKNPPWPSLAARFAAKEAFVKALWGICGRGVRYRDVEIVRDPGGPPRVRLLVAVPEMKGRSVSVSLTHTRDHASACVLIHDGEEP